MLVTEKMREKLKNFEYFEKKISIIYASINNSLNQIKIGEIKPERVDIVKQGIVIDYLAIISSKYSAGYPIKELIDDLLKAIALMNESWDGFWKHDTGKIYKGKSLCQYGLDATDQVLWLLSYGYLLNINVADFNKIVEVIDRENVQDFLFEFIIRAKITDREIITEESYNKHLGIPKIFGKLREAITQTDKAAAELLVKEFITKDWYKNHRGSGWHDSHKSIHEGYTGYWSFETAAVVKIMGLDDSSFINCKYYPADLVHYNQG